MEAACEVFYVEKHGVLKKHTNLKGVFGQIRLRLAISHSIEIQFALGRNRFATEYFSCAYFISICNVAEN